MIFFVKLIQKLQNQLEELDEKEKKLAKEQEESIFCENTQLQQPQQQYYPQPYPSW